jgi:predicted metalloprotease
MTTPSPKTRLRLGGKLKTCIFCKATNEEKDFGSYKSYCSECIIDFKAFKRRLKEKGNRVSACKLMMQELKTAREDEVIAYSDISTTALTGLIQEFKDLVALVKQYKAMSESQAQTISKLKTRVSNIVEEWNSYRDQSTEDMEKMWDQIYQTKGQCKAKTPRLEKGMVKYKANHHEED